MMGDSPAELVQCLSAWISGAGIGLLELRTPERTIVLRQAGAVATPAAQAAVSTTTVAAPSLGVFLHRHPLASTALAALGQRVRKGDPLGLLRIGALLLPVPAPLDGVVADYLAEDGRTVGYGAPLIRLRPA